MEYIFLASLIAGLGTCLGTGIILLCKSFSNKFLSFLLGFAAGVMIAVVIFDLIPSSFYYGTILTVINGFLLGIGLMFIFDLLLSLLKITVEKSLDKNFLKMGYLIIVGIALHDFPEGLAIAAGYSAAEQLGPLLALAIGLHNIPEGIAFSAPLKLGGLKAKTILLFSLLVSLVTPLGTLTGILLVNISPKFISLLIAFAAGAMTYIVKNELLPQAYLHNKSFANTGLISGLFLIGLLTFKFL